MNTKHAWILCGAWLALGACSESSGGGDTASAAEVTGDSSDGDTGDTTDTGDTAADTSTYCPPNQRFCKSVSEAAVCNETGDAEVSSSPCVGRTVCDSRTGMCRPTICEPSEQACRNLDEYEICNIDGSGWGPLTECPEGTFCADGLCRVCQAERVECLSQTTFRECAPDSSGWSVELPCPDDHWCVNNQCRPCGMTFECVTDKKSRQYCASEEIDYDVEEVCEIEQSCDDGVCVSCDPGGVECVGDDQFRECQSDGKSWGPTVNCGVEEVCIVDTCMPYICVPRVLLVVDQSGSMGSHWASVQASIEALVEQNPTIRFGLLTFPTGGWSCDVAGVLQIDFVQNDKAAFTSWFEANIATGGTPLAEAADVVLENAETIFGAYGGSVIYLSDGQDGCYRGTEDIKVALAIAASKLLLDHGVSTYAIGYSFGGSPEELDTLANNGGTGVGGHIAAGSESELTEAFDKIVKDLKVCDGQ